MRLPLARRWRTAACASVVALLAPLGVGASALAAPSTPVPRAQASVAELRADMARTTARLAAATEAWERGQARLGVLLQRKFATGRTAELLQEQAVEAQARVSSLANSLYRNPVSPVVNAVLAGNLAAVTDFAYVTRGAQRTGADQRRDLALLATQAADTQALLEHQDEAASAAIRLQSQLDDDLARLQADAWASAARLQAAVDALRRQREAIWLFGSSGSGGPPCTGPVPAGALNGFLPAGALCSLRSAPRHRLVAQAASAFDAMSAAFAQSQGTGLCVTDSYRDYAGQVDVFRRKPNLAATPGRSEHGWGRAVDLCGGAERFGSAAYLWLKQSGPAFGFAHPDWAEPGGSKPEPWHWEFVA